MGMLADAILVVHFLFIAFVLGGQGCIIAGAFRRWTWIRQCGFRLAHLVAIAVIVVQSWVGMMCPLTLWESTCRRTVGEQARLFRRPTVGVHNRIYTVRLDRVGELVHRET
jgi:hypothetical protein